jgi:AMMECR1 domain-containing protein
MGEYLDWMKFGVMFVVILIIQFVTRTKAVADGMMYRQIMIENHMDANDIIQKIKEEADKARRNNDIN